MKSSVCSKRLHFVPSPLQVTRLGCLPLRFLFKPSKAIAFLKFVVRIQSVIEQSLKPQFEWFHAGYSKVNIDLYSHFGRTSRPARPASGPGALWLVCLTAAVLAQDRVPSRNANAHDRESVPNEQFIKV